MSTPKVSKQYKRALFIHRRDLRVQDNTGLNEAMIAAEEVLPCFIFDPIQVGDANEYRSARQVLFMQQSLEDLAEQYGKVEGELHLYAGKPEEVVQSLIEKGGVDAVFVNGDYTPYSRKRDALLEGVCKKANVPFFSYHDLLLAGDPELVKTGMNKAFTVFTPYWRKAAAVSVPTPVALKKGSFVTGPIFKEIEKSYAATLAYIDSVTKGIEGETNAEQGGRKAARDILAHISDFRAYATTHNTPSEETTRLSAHNKFGNVSIREVYHALGKAMGYGNPIIRQLYWRDFYTVIVYFFPHVVGASFDPKHEILYTSEDPEAFSKWKEGKTGMPIVDAGMRELNETGYMHNRVRLIVGSFLTKDLHQPWWLGEKYFAQKLVDYDLSVNNGNWQWVGGTGVDPVPYFRVFNPWLQGKKFDPNAYYIKRWVPELQDVSAADVHNIPKKLLADSIDYPKPMLDHAIEMKKVRALYKPDTEATPEVI